MSIRGSLVSAALLASAVGLAVVPIASADTVPITALKDKVSGGWTVLNGCASVQTISRGGEIPMTSERVCAGPSNAANGWPDRGDVLSPGIAWGYRLIPDGNGTVVACSVLVNGQMATSEQASDGRTVECLAAAS